MYTPQGPHASLHILNIGLRKPGGILRFNPPKKWRPMSKLQETMRLNGKKPKKPQGIRQCIHLKVKSEIGYIHAYTLHYEKSSVVRDHDL